MLKGERTWDSYIFMITFLFYNEVSLSALFLDDTTEQREGFGLVWQDRMVQGPKTDQRQRRDEYCCYDMMLFVCIHTDIQGRSTLLSSIR